MIKDILEKKAIKLVIHYKEKADSIKNSLNSIKETYFE